MYYPVVEFFVGQNRFSFKSDSGSSTKAEEGTKMVVMYNPINPSIAFIEENYFLGPNICIALGVSFLLFSLAVISVWL